MKSKLSTLAAGRGEEDIVDRGAIETKLYHRCRAQCGTRLSPPVENPHKAFRCKGCYNEFYRPRCVVCEKVKPEGSTSRRVVCRRPKCGGRYRRDRAIYSFSTPDKGLSFSTPKSADKSKAEIGPFGRRPWRQIAGPPLGEAALRAAVIPDGPNGQWAGGAIDRTEAHARAALRAHFADLAKDCLIQPHHPPINILGGNKEWLEREPMPAPAGERPVMRKCKPLFPDAPAIGLTSPAQAPIDGVQSDWKPYLPSDHATTPGLEIPAFLRRGGAR